MPSILWLPHPYIPYLVNSEARAVPSCRLVLTKRVNPCVLEHLTHQWLLKLIHGASVIPGGQLGRANCCHILKGATNRCTLIIKLYSKWNISSKLKIVWQGVAFASWSITETIFALLNILYVGIVYNGCKKNRFSIICNYWLSYLSSKRIVYAYW